MLLRKRDVLQLTALGEGQLDALRRAGQFVPETRIGLRPFWRRQDVLDWLAARRFGRADLQPARQLPPDVADLL